MRVTHLGQLHQNLGNLRRGSERVARGEAQVATGRQLLRPSDDPGATRHVLDFKSRIARTGQHQRNRDDAASWLGTIDGALALSSDRVASARSLLLEGVNASTPPDARAAIATQLRAVADELIAVANRRNQGRPVFGGTTSSPDAFAADGSFLGDANPVLRTIGIDDRVTVSVIGTDAFGTNSVTDPLSGSIFQVLRAAADALEAGDTATATSALDSLNAGHDRITDVLGRVGAVAARVEQQASELMQQETTARTELSQLEDADLAEALVELRSSQSSYEASLAVIARSEQASLIDFLR